MPWTPTACPALLLRRVEQQQHRQSWTHTGQAMTGLTLRQSQSTFGAWMPSKQRWALVGTHKHCPAAYVAQQLSPQVFIGIDKPPLTHPSPIPWAQRTHRVHVVVCFRVRVWAWCCTWLVPCPSRRAPGASHATSCCPWRPWGDDHAWTCCATCRAYSGGALGGGGGPRGLGVGCWGGWVGGGHTTVVPALKSLWKPHIILGGHVV